MWWAASGVRPEKDRRKWEGLWLRRSEDRPSQGKYERHFSPQSLSRAIKPLIGVESRPSVQFSPVFLCNLKPVLTAELRLCRKSGESSPVPGRSGSPWSH
jgi:hypothetical protein